MLSDIVRVVDLQGRIKERRKITSELNFDFIIDSVGKFVFFSLYFACKGFLLAYTYGRKEDWFSSQRRRRGKLG